MTARTARKTAPPAGARSSRADEQHRNQPEKGARWHQPARLLEGCWLLLAFLTPALFNPASMRVFEPEKVAFVRAVALAMAAIWAVEKLTSSSRSRDACGGARARDRGRMQAVLPGTALTPTLSQGEREPITHSPTLSLAHSVQHIALPVAALMGCYLGASIFSELPGAAGFGSYRRQFGLVTHLSFALIFLAVATHLRTPAHGRRLLYAIALGALIPSVYAVLQKLGVDPIPWSVDNSRRVVGTLGQPTFLGAYLALTIPASLWLLLQPASLRRRLGLGLLLALQLSALVFSQSRAAWAGAAVGALVVLGIQFWSLRSRRFGRPVAGMAALSLIFLLALNLPGSPFGGLARSVPYLERLATLADFETGSGRVRAVIWQTLPALIAERPFFGHGPDMMGYAFERHYPPALAYAENRTAAADQAHNVLLQQLVIAGVPGLAAFLWLVVAVGLRVSGKERKDGKKGGSAGSGVGSARGRVGTAGECNSPLHPVLLLRPLRPLPDHSVLSPQPSVLPPAAGALVAYLVEQMAGVQSASSSLVFWLLLGLVAASPRGGEWETERVGDSGPARSSVPSPQHWSGVWRWRVVGVAVLVAAVGIWRLSVLPLVADVRAASAAELASRGRFEEAARAYVEAASLHPEAEYHLLLGQMATDVAERGPAQNRERWLQRAEEALSLGEKANPLDLDVALAQGRLYGMLATLTPTGTALTPTLSQREREYRGLSQGERESAISLTPATSNWKRAEAAYARALSLSPNRSYVHNRLGTLLAAQGRYAEAIDRYRTSLALDPNYASTHAYLADSLLAMGRTQEALDDYLQAERLDPSLVLVHINLAELYLRMGRPRDAVASYEEAVRLAPSDPALRSRLAEVQRLAP